MKIECRRESYMHTRGDDLFGSDRSTQRSRSARRDSQTITDVHVVREPGVEYSSKEVRPATHDQVNLHKYTCANILDKFT